LGLFCFNFDISVRQPDSGLPHPLAILLPNLAGGNKSIELLSFHAGDGFFFLDLPFAWIVDQSAVYPRFIRRIAAIAT
jgi:hypothetical protein